MIQGRRDLSISMLSANMIVALIAIPLMILQFAFYSALHGMRGMQPSLSIPTLIAVIVIGIGVHEVIHGVTWAVVGRKRFSAVKFGFHWKTFTPYAYLPEPVEVRVYRTAAFMPGLLLGILPYLISLFLADGNLFWFSVVHTSAAGGDFLILWLIRNVEAGMHVEDHPSNAGCYVLEP